MTTTNEGTQRDELARDIFLADNSNFPEDSLLTAWDEEAEELQPYAHNIADGLIAAGYRKPRTITTVEELDALPAGSVVLDPRGISLHKTKFCGWVSSNMDRNIGGESLERSALPATVLHEPEAEATR